MMRHIVAASLRFRFLLVAMALGMTVIGLGQIKSMPIDVFPEFSPPYVEIQTLAVGLAPEEVESLISVPMEEVLAGTPELETIRSKSANDLSVIDMYFKRGTNQLDARQLVQERMDLVAPRLPTWAAPPVMLQPLSATSRAMKIGITSDKLNGIQQSMIAYWSIRQRLLQVPGVANVPIWGERLEMLNVNVDRTRMAAQNVSLEEVMTTTSDALDAGLMRFSEGAHIGTGGFVEAGTQRTGIRHKLPIASAAELSQVVVRPGVNGGAPLRIADVADVMTGHQPMIGDAVIGGGPGLMLVVEKLPWANTLDVTRGVEKALDEMKPGLPDLTIDTHIFRPATFIETSLHNLSSALLLGCLLVILMLFLFLYEWRVALISIVAIPLSLVVATLVLAWRGTTINTMILAGFAIALGDVVDDAIIDIENVVRRLRQHRAAGNPGSTAGVVLRASMEVRGAIIYATLIEVVAIVPILFLGGLSGAFFRPMVLSYALALIASMGVALTLTPALALIVVRKAPLRRRQAPVASLLQRGYGRLLTKVVRSPKPAFASVVLLLTVGVALGPGLGQSLMPDFKERDFLMHFINRPGTSLAEEVRITTESGKLVSQVPGVRTFGAHIGQAFQSDESVGVEMAERWISIDPKADYDKTLAAVEATNANYPGLVRDVQTYLNERIDEVLEGTSFPIVVRMFGSDIAVLRAKADEVAHALKGIKGITDLMSELQTEVPQIQVKVDLDKAQKIGLKPGDVRRAASAQIQGEEVGDIFRDGKAYDINVWSPQGKRQNLDDLRNLPLDTPDGKTVRMADVASVELKSSVNYIRHENNARKIDVTADVSGRDLGAVVGDIQQRLKKIDFPAGYRFEMMGAYAERQAANKRIRDVGLLAAIAIFLLLQASYGSFRLATLSFLTLPMALVGGVIAAWMTGGVISLGSVAGFLTVIGMVARHGIMLISHFRHLERYEGVPFGPELVIQGAKERLVPITMTVLATGLALLPLALSGSIPGQEIEFPMACVILGGLVAATFTNLFVVPSLYLAFGRSRQERASVGETPALAAG
jgi:CzcA family heavy metal efflux pump